MVFDLGWQTRIPPGWVTFPDGSIGPPNPESPFDSAWPTRQPRAPGTTISTVPGQPMDLPGGDVASTSAGTRTPGYTGGPEIIPPQGSNVGTGKEVGPRTNPFTDAFTKPYINPQTGQPELLGAPDTAATAAKNTPWWLGKGGFWPTLLYSTLYPTSTASNDTIPPPTPFQQPAHPSTMRYPGWPTPPASTPAPVSSGSGYGGMPPAAWGGTDVPLPPVKPASLRGNGKAKSAPLQVLTPVDRAGMYALGGQTQAIGAGRNPLAYDPYYQGFRT